MDEPTRGPASTDEQPEPVQAAGAAPGEAAAGNDAGSPESAAAPDAGYPEPPARKRRAWMIGGLGLLVIVLAAAAYVGGRWLNRAPAAAAAGPGKGQMMVMTNKGGVSRSFQIEPARELPQSTPDLAGVVVRRQDNSLFLGTGNIKRLIQKGSDSSVQAPPPSYDGPVLEAVVTHDTQVFRDDTNVTAPPSSAESGTIQQVVRPGSLDEITTNSQVQVWGVKSGDRTIARVLVYRPG